MSEEAGPTQVEVAHPVDRNSVLVGCEPATWRPSGVGEALRALDEIARFCLHCCYPTTDLCIEEQCRPWNLERVALCCLEQRRLNPANDPGPDEPRTPARRRGAPSF